MSRRDRLRAILPASVFILLERGNVHFDTWKRSMAASGLRRRHIGRNSFIERDVHVLGWRSVTIGDHVIIGSRTVLNVNFPDAAIERIVIGSWSFVGQQNFFSPGDRIELGPYCLTGIGCRFLGAGHNFDDPFVPYIASGISNAGVIRAGCNVWFGVGATVLGSVDIGHGSVIGANALVTADVPPFSMVVGSPGRIVRRYDILSRSWVRAEQFTAAMEAALPDDDAYRTIIERRTPHIHMPYRAAGFQRGDLA